MTSEITRAKEVLDFVFQDNNDLIKNYFKVRNFEEGLQFCNGEIKWAKFKNILEAKDNILDELSKILAFDNACDEVDKIIDFYATNYEHEFTQVIQNLQQQKNLTHFERGLFIAIHDRSFFEKCFAMINIHASNQFIYEVFNVQKNVEISQENITRLEQQIGELIHSKYKAGKHCLIERIDVCDSYIFNVKTNKGARRQETWNENKPKKEKTLPVLEFVFIYNSAKGQLEIGVLRNRKMLCEMVEKFSEIALENRINASRITKIWNLQMIQKAIYKCGGFANGFIFKNTLEMQPEITDLCFTKNACYYKTSRGHLDEKNFLKIIKQTEEYIDLHKVCIRASFRDSVKRIKTRSFFIEFNKTNLTHDKIDKQIKAILNNSGLCEITDFDLKEAFQKLLESGRIVNFYDLEIKGFCTKPFEIFLDSNLITISTETHNLSCVKCKTQTLTFNDNYASCSECGDVFFASDFCNNYRYKLDVENLKNRLANCENITQDNISSDDGYFGYIEHKIFHKINLYIKQNEREKIVGDGKKIVFFMDVDANVNYSETDIVGRRLLDYIMFKKSGEIHFEKSKLDELISSFYNEKADLYIEEKRRGGENSYKKYKPLIAKVEELCAIELQKNKTQSALKLCQKIANIIENKYADLLNNFLPYTQSLDDKGTDWTRPTFYGWCNKIYKKNKA